MTDQRATSQQPRGGFGKPKPAHNGHAAPENMQMMVRPPNPPPMQPRRDNEQKKALPPKTLDGRAPQGAEMLHKRPAPRQPDASKPAAQPARLNPQGKRMEYKQWEDKEFLPIHMRKGPMQQAPAPFLPPAKDPRRGNKAPEARKPAPAHGGNTKELIPIGGSSRASANQPSMETIQVGQDTYTQISVLQAAKPQSGGMSQGVYLVRDKDNRKWVLKRLSTSTKSKRERSQAEVDALKRVKTAIRSHENLNMIRDASLPGNAPQGTLILEYCDAGTLAEGIDLMKARRLECDESFAFHVFYSLAKALAMLHHGYADHTNPHSQIRGWSTICHLDIKPANILLTNEPLPGRSRHEVRRPRIVLADFGCSVTADEIRAGRESKVAQENGTPGWFPPEEAGAQPQSQMTGMLGRYGKPTDVWQVAGVVQCITALLYQPDMSVQELPMGRRYSPEINCLVAACLNAEYLLRPTAMDLCGEMRRVMRRKGLL